MRPIFRPLVIACLLAGCATAASPATGGSPSGAAAVGASTTRFDLPGQAPAIHSFAVTPRQIAKGGTFTLVANVTSPIGKPLSYSWFADKGTLSDAAGTSTVTWRPVDRDGNVQAGTATIGMTVTDGGGANTATAVFNVAADGSASSAGGTAMEYQGHASPGATGVPDAMAPGAAE